RHQPPRPLRLPGRRPHRTGDGGAGNAPDQHSRYPEAHVVARDAARPAGEGPGGHHAPAHRQAQEMKISHVTTRVLSTPADNPLVVGLPVPTDTREFVLLELGTDQGLVGLGLTFFGGALTPALKAAVDGLARLVIGDDPAQTEAIAAKCKRAAGSSGPGGIYTLALSALDMACWDLKGKAAGQSVCALLGGLRDRVATYASGALMRPHPTDYLAKAGPRLAGMGFRQMKM